MAKEQLLYKNLAKYYDLIYHFKDYNKEAKEIKEIISKHKKSKGKELLEVACGTGKHLKYLKSNFNCTGIDINRGMINVAKKEIKGVSFKTGNMINFNLKKKFDVITCLFSSIGYVKTYGNLKKTIKNFSKHLNIGGILIIEPWITKKEYRIGDVNLQTYEDKDIKIARETFAGTKENISVLEMHYLIAENKKGIKHFSEFHKLGLFEVDKTLRIMEDAGLKAKFKKTGGRGLYVGIKIK